MLLNSLFTFSSRLLGMTNVNERCGFGGSTRGLISLRAPFLCLKPKNRKGREKECRFFLFLFISQFQLREKKTNSLPIARAFSRCARTRGGSMLRRHRATHRGCSLGGARGQENGSREASAAALTRCRRRVHHQVPSPQRLCLLSTLPPPPPTASSPPRGS